jgi:nitrite reductase/ring-hydroxylating ferredoxin subunit
LASPLHDTLIHPGGAEEAALMDKDRRTFCQASCAALCAAALPIPLAGCKNVGGDVWTITSFKAADVVIDEPQLAQVADNSMGGTPISHNFWFCRDAGGLYVMDANCTHARCVLMFVPADPSNMMPVPTFGCSCHGSTFDFNGQMPTPPAPRPLDHYKLSLADGGVLVVDASTIVDPSTRIAG